MERAEAYTTVLAFVKFDSVMIADRASGQDSCITLVCQEHNNICIIRRLKANQELSRLNLYPSLESMAPGKYFTEDSPISSRNLMVYLERRKLLRKRVEQMVKYSERWKSKGFYESAEIAGVTEISYPRTGERESEALHLVVRSFRYFAFLATNANVKLRNDLEEEDREWLLRQTENYDPNEPIPAFVNPLSVDVLLLSDEERKFVLTRRSGHTVYRGGLIGLSAAETVSTSLDQRDGEIDLVNTVRRALNEEIGIQAEHLEESSYIVIQANFERGNYQNVLVLADERVFSFSQVGFRHNTSLFFE
jgi:hypothetical protein